jgi:hypothetical protein
VQFDSTPDNSAAGREAGRPRLPALVAVAAAVLLLTSACEGTKEFACKSSATIDGWFGTGTSEDRAEDCGGSAGQGASSSAGSKEKGASQAARPAGPHADPATVADVQTRLAKLGYDPGPADGQLGPKTRAAIRAYQKDSDLKADGQVTASLVERIKAE